MESENRAVTSDIEADAHVADKDASILQTLEQHRGELATAEQTGDHAGIARALRGLGVTYGRLGENEAALDYLQRALAVDEQIGERLQSALTLSYIGNVCWNAGDFATCLDYYTRARRIQEAEGDAGASARSLINIARVHWKLDDHATAMDHVRESLDILEEIGDRVGIAHTCAGMGVAHAETGDFVTALEFMARALAIREELDDRAGIAEVLGNMGLAYSLLGDHDRALEHCQRSYSICEELGDPGRLAESHWGIGDALAACDRLDEARGHYERALAMTAAPRDVLASIHRDYSELLQTLGEHELAISHLKEYYRIREELTTEEARRRLYAMEATRKLEIATKEAELERLRRVELAAALDELKSAQAQLVHAEKMSSLGQLTAGIAHEINNPLNFIRSSIKPLQRDVRQLIEGDVDEDDRSEIIDEVEQLLRGIEEGTNRTAEIVKSLRTFSRLDENELKTIDLLEGLQSTLTLLRPRLEGIALTKDLRPLPDVDCHGGQINQVLMNLLMNAADAAGIGGVITIRSWSDGAMANIAVEDNGPGIAPEHRARIFEPFFTTKPVGSGQGLGLAIAHSIIEEHGGAIDVESIPGAGSTFTVRLPLRTT